VLAGTHHGHTAEDAGDVAPSSAGAQRPVYFAELTVFACRSKNDRGDRGAGHIGLHVSRSRAGLDDGCGSSDVLQSRAFLADLWGLRMLTRNHTAGRSDTSRVDVSGPLGQSKNASILSGGLGRLRG